MSGRQPLFITHYSLFKTHSTFPTLQLHHPFSVVLEIGETQGAGSHFLVLWVEAEGFVEKLVCQLRVEMFVGIATVDGELVCQCDILFAIGPEQNTND